MFRKLTDRLSAAINGNDDKVATLQQMGFDPNQARAALETTGGNIDSAAELLLSSTFQTHATASYREDFSIQNAMEESLETEYQRIYQQAQNESVQENQLRSAANSKAAQAAIKRANDQSKKISSSKMKRTAAISKNAPARNTQKIHSTQHDYPMEENHPNVKVPPKLENKTKEEQIIRNVDRAKSHPAAVDTLYKALSALKNHPDNEKFRRIDKSTQGYQRSVANVPGAEALLLAMNFTLYNSSILIIDRKRIDPALLYLGVSALEEAKCSKEYKEAKILIQFNEEVKKITSPTKLSENEAILRDSLLSKCPNQPLEGRGALIQIRLGDELLKRSFDSDDVLQDVLNWLGGHGSCIPDKLVNREWCLVDKNRYPIKPIDCEINSNKTLQYIGFWPSGKLEIKPSPLF
mmetsp:Transcript_1453/g.1949  ORF Transcript_1453/g.1949 Transcript_1453/m.1949 type:complete len:408 (-) Transcript_1453:1229-2452(-)|eukprot:CAMPEP_0178915170 /NCGR_PEP_ID=MMETSP0786-20121207/11868_1 /TAXON_ID=186022 /ORGANISM="Thalassionema frauenfeldii, Strain CCMP 1798" /LENGTH=407 /DNA_ID=CAMNT_0020588231 /DNA_START=263 /DNA_END=1486 /DNA_ORIENTATION=-